MFHGGCITLEGENGVHDVIPLYSPLKIRGLRSREEGL